MKKVSDVFKAIRFAKLDPKHNKGHKGGSTDDEEHGAVDEKEFDQQLKHVKKRAMQEDTINEVTRRGILKGIVGAAAAGAVGKASAIAGAFPSPSTKEKWRKDAEESNRNEVKRQAEKRKQELEKNTKEVDKEQRKNHHSLSNESVELDEADKRSFIGRIQRGQELKKKVDSSFKDIGDAQKRGDRVAGSKAFRKHERYANLERPGTWTKVKEEIEQLDEIGDTNKGQKLLRMVNKRAVDRVTSKRADTDPAYAKKAQQNHLAANERLKEDTLQEGRPSQRHPLEGHEYHKKSNDELVHIAKDAHEAAEAMKSHNTTAENKYRDQASDSATVRYWRKKNGTPDWYKKKYSLKESEEICKNCECDPCECDDSHGFVTETKRMSAAVKLQRAFEREQSKNKSRMATSKEQDDAWEKTKQHLSKPENMAVLKRLKNEETMKEGYNDYHNNRTGFAKRHREDDEYHVPDPVDNRETHTVKMKLSKDGGEVQHKQMNVKTLHGAEHARKFAHETAKKQGWTVHEEVEVVEEGKMGEKSAGDLDFNPVVKNNKPPFDGPYKKKTSVTPGKHGSGYSTARHLARQAMAKVAKIKIKEESELSPKAQIVKSAAKKTKNSDDKFEPNPVLAKHIGPGDNK